MANSLESVLECSDLDAMVAFFVDQLRCRVELITPADDPAEYVVAGHGARLRLVRGADVAGRLRLFRSDVPAGTPTVTLVAPNGTAVEVRSAVTGVEVPEGVPSVSVVHADADQEFGVGRAGMGYRDLLPDRWGGRFIASHILIADGGDVADYVHFHRIRFQMIFVAAGWVDVVYEDQGEPFRLHAGDCVLQPPEIRHRVLRSSPGLEVIEIGCPAEHDTVVDHDLALPTAEVDGRRMFGGQRFVRHVATDAVTTTSVTPGFVERDTGISEATSGLADARLLTLGSPSLGSDVAFQAPAMTHRGEFAMFVVLGGTVTISITADHDHPAGPGEKGGGIVRSVGPRDAIAVPAAHHWRWSEPSADIELLQVTLPGGCVRRSETGRAAAHRQNAGGSLSDS